MEGSFYCDINSENINKILRKKNLAGGGELVNHAVCWSILDFQINKKKIQDIYLLIFIFFWGISKMAMSKLEPQVRSNQCLHKHISKNHYSLSFWLILALSLSCPLRHEEPSFHVFNLKEKFLSVFAESVTQL